MTQYTFSARRLLKAFAAAAVFICLLSAQTDSVAGEDRAATRFEEIKERLKLTPEQVERARPVIERELEQLRQTLRGFDRNSATMREKRKVARQVKSIRENTEKQLKEILSPAQFSEWKRMREERRNQIRERSAGAKQTRPMMAGPAPAEQSSPSPFRLSWLGCPMAHCDPKMSDRVILRAPTTVSSEWSDSTAASEETGLGCSATPFVAVCSFGPAKNGAPMPQLKAYDASGKVLWHSADILNGSAWTSVPLLSRTGEAIAADDQVLVRFSAKGKVVWRTATPGGRPISPTLTRNGAVVLATAGGPVSAYRSDSGELVGTLDLSETLDGLRGRFETTNTPGAQENRVYISTEFKLQDGSADPNHHARLYAVDVDPSQGAEASLKVAWFYEFGARSGASPLVIGDRIYFDGDRTSPSGAFAPRFFALRDEGASARLLWDYQLSGPAAASAARDPRGGLWVFALGGTSLLRLGELDGALLDTIDLASVSGVTGARPWSAISIAHGRSGRPALIVSARATTAAWIMSVDLDERSVIWKEIIGNDSYGDLPRGQWPILAAADGRRVLVFTTRNGVRAFGGPI